MDPAFRSDNIVFRSDDISPASEASVGATANTPLATPSIDEPNIPRQKNGPSLFRFNRLAFLITAGILLLIALIVAGSLNFFRKDNREQAPQLSAGNYNVEDLDLGNIGDGGKIQFSAAERLVINGQLKVSNTFVLAPTDAPNNPVAGQMYYDRSTNILYYHNGTEFIGLRAINNAVLSIQGQTGDVNFSAGSGIALNGTTISNTGVLSLSGTANQVQVSQSRGSITLSLPQNIHTGATPTFAGLTLNSPLGISSGGTGSTSFNTNGVAYFNGTALTTTAAPGSNGLCLLSAAGGPEFNTCPGGGGGVTSLNGLSGALTLSNASGAGSTITIDNATTAAKGIASFDASDFDVAAGAVTLDASVTQQGNTFNGANQLVQLNASTQLPAVSGALLTSLNASNLASGTVDSARISGSYTGITGTGVLNAGSITSGFGSIALGTDSLQGGSLIVGVASSANGSIVFNNSTNANTVTLQSGVTGASYALTLPTAVGGAAQCLKESDGTGTLVWADCLGGGGGGVTSVDGQTGPAVAINNATGAGNAITIDNAAADGATKGIATFNATNFSAAAGVVNTIQNINTTANPQFANLTLTGGLTVQGGSGTFGSTANTGSLVIHDNDAVGGQTVTFTTGNIGTSYTLILPTAVGGAAQCLKESDGTGTLVWADCLGGGGGGVTSVDGQTGPAISINNATGAGNAITIDNAAADGATKGIATFNATNFSAAAGVVNTIQNINTTATPQFAGLTLTGNLSIGANSIVTSGATISAAELNLLDSHDVALVDTNDAVATAITGTGALNAGSITSGFGAIALGTDSLQGGSLNVGIAGPAGTNGSIVFNNSTNANTVTLQSGVTGASYSLTLPTGAGNQFQCLKYDTGGQLIWDNCEGGGGGTGGVASLNGLTGTLSIANASGAGSTITINNAAADGATKGIAAFNSTNFSAAAGVINTIQNISTSSSPVFVSPNATTGVNTGAGAGTQRIDASGNLVNIGNVTTSGVSTFSTTGANGFIFKPGSNNTTAFQVQNASSGSLLNVDSTNSNITLLGNNSGELGAWSTNANALPAGRVCATSVTANGYVYVIGGSDTNTCYFASSGQSTVYYAKLNADGSTAAWSTNANALPAARQCATSITANGYVYVLGGNDSDSSCSTPQSTVYYAKLNADGSTGAWSSGANTLPAARNCATSVTANGYVYVIGGATGSACATAQSTVYYAKLNADGSTGAWSTNANALPAARKFATSVVANGYVYVMGGGSTVYYAKLNADGSTGAWSTNANALPAARTCATSAVANGYVYVMGGDATSTTCDGGSSAVATAYYAKLNADGSTGAWSTNTSTLPDARACATSVLANGYIYVMGGDSGNSCTTAQSTVYYASTSRLQIGAANLDLVGLQGGNLSEAGDQSTGSSGGSITAGNGLFVGILQVQGNASFAQGLSADGNLTIGGSALFKNSANSTIAFQIQNAAGTSLFTTDTTNSIITIAGTTTTFANLTLTNAHFKSTQTTAPTIGTPTNCGTTPTAAVKAGSTDSAGAFRITAGTGSPTTCDTVITFNKAYGTAPKTVVVSPETVDGGTGTAAARQIYVSATGTTTFTVKFNSSPAASEENWFYYWVVE